MSRGLGARFQDTGHRPWRLGTSVSRFQREVKGILTHVEFTEHLRFVVYSMTKLTHPSSSDGVAPNSTATVQLL